MERELVLSSFDVKSIPWNEPENFVIKFNNPLVLDRNKEFEVGLNRVISMSFTWFNVNPGHKNQLIRFSRDGGKTWTDITFPEGVWGYAFIKEKTGASSNKKCPIELAFNDTTFRVTLTLATNFKLDLTKSNFFDLIGFDKKIVTLGVNVGPKVPNLSQDTGILNIH